MMIRDGVIEIIFLVNWMILIYFFFLSLIYIILLIASLRDLYERFLESKIGKITSLLKSYVPPPVSVAICAYNEEDFILNTIDSVLRNSYPNVEILVINDGSTDATLETLIKKFSLYKIFPSVPQRIKTHVEISGYYISKTHPHITVIDKVNSGKSDALNMAVNVCRTPLFITLDADSIIEPDALDNIVYCLLRKSHTVAVGGGVYVINGCEYKDGAIIKAKMSYNPVVDFQTIEYLRSFIFGRTGLNVLGGAMCFAGTFTLFEYKSLVDAGGFEYGNDAQDFEIITRLHAEKAERHYPYNILYTSSAISWTDVPDTLIKYWKQRFVWQRDILRSIMQHKKMLFNPKYGITGFFTYPFYLFGETLSCLVEFTAYINFFLSWHFDLLEIHLFLHVFFICMGFLITFTLITTFVSMISFNKYKRTRDLIWVLFLTTIELLGFHQYYVLCRVCATVRYFFGRKLKS